MSTVRDKGGIILIALVLCILLFCVCNENRRGGKPEINTNTIKALPRSLHALLYPEYASFGSSRKSNVKAVIINNDTREIPLNMWNLGQSMLALDIVDSRGNRILTIGPSTPLPREEMKKFMRILKPGDQIDIDYNLNIFNPELPPGKYSVRMVSVSSNTVHIGIGRGLLHFKR